MTAREPGLLSGEVEQRFDDRRSGCRLKNAADRPLRACGRILLKVTKPTALAGTIVHVRHSQFGRNWRSEPATPSENRPGGHYLSARWPAARAGGARNWRRTGRSSVKARRRFKFPRTRTLRRQPFRHEGRPTGRIHDARRPPQTATESLISGPKGPVRSLFVAVCWTGDGRPRGQPRCFHKIAPAAGLA